MNMSIDEFCKDIATEKSLTDREYEVLKLIMKGYLIKQIACELDLAECTVKIHTGKICKKLNVSSRTKATIFVYQSFINKLMDKA